MGRVSNSPFSVDVLVVGGGPAGSAAAIHAAKAGYSALLIDAQPFPRDKTCGDGLTPRAVHQLEALGVDVTSRYRSFGLKLHGFGGSVTVPWPESHFGQLSSAMPRMEFDAMLWEMAAQHATTWTATASEVEIDSAIRSVTMSDGRVVKPRSVIVADGVRSTFGKLLGRTWHRGEVYGIAARSYCTTPRSTEPWMHSHLELRDDSTTLPGYGWIFPLGDGTANVGCGALSTDKRPAKINTKKLLRHYASQQTDWGLAPPNGWLQHCYPWAAQSAPSQDLTGCSSAMLPPA